MEPALAIIYDLRKSCTLYISSATWKTCTDHQLKCVVETDFVSIIYSLIRTYGFQ